MFVNEVNITGKVYNPSEKTTSTGKTITEFGLSVYAGKNSEGKSQYKFMSCKLWDHLGRTEGDILVKGSLKFDVWTKDGKEYSRPYILVNEISTPEDTKANFEKAVALPEDKPVLNEDKDIPF